MKWIGGGGGFNGESGKIEGRKRRSLIAGREEGRHWTVCACVCVCGGGSGRGRRIQGMTRGRG